MRGKLSEQDLTNYALNDGLDPRERLYVESMLGASEPCRDDVYKMLEMATLLERGFEQQSDRTIPSLTRAQREKLIAPQPERFRLVPFIRKTAATFSLAACVAFVFVNPAGLFHEQRRNIVAAVNSEVARMVEGIDESTTEDQEDYTVWITPSSVDNQDSNLIQTSGDGSGMPGMPEEAICTPPSAKDSAESTGEVAP